MIRIASSSALPQIATRAPALAGETSGFALAFAALLQGEPAAADPAGTEEMRQSLAGTGKDLPAEDAGDGEDSGGEDAAPVAFAWFPLTLDPVRVPEMPAATRTGGAVPSTARSADPGAATAVSPGLAEAKPGEAPPVPVLPATQADPAGTDPATQIPGATIDDPHPRPSARAIRPGEAPAIGAAQPTGSAARPTPAIGPDSAKIGPVPIAAAPLAVAATAPLSSARAEAIAPSQPSATASTGDKPGAGPKMPGTVPSDADAAPAVPPAAMHAAPSTTKPATPSVTTPVMPPVTTSTVLSATTPAVPSVTTPAVSPLTMPATTTSATPPVTAPATTAVTALAGAGRTADAAAAIEIDRPASRRTRVRDDIAATLPGAAPAGDHVSQAAVPAAVDTRQGSLDLARHDWMEGMIDHIETLRDASGARETRIRLSPDALGTIDIAVRHEGGRMHVHFTADTDTARALLNDAAPQLVQMAEARGLRLGQASVDVGTGGGQRQAPAPETGLPAAPPSARAEPETTTSTDQRIA